MTLSGKKLAVLAGISAAIVVAVSFFRGIAHAEGRDVLRCLCDGFFVGGALVLIAGTLVWTADQGVADGLGYSVSRFFRRRGPNYDDRRETYSEYKERKHYRKTGCYILIGLGSLSNCSDDLAFLLIEIKKFLLVVNPAFEQCHDISNE